MNNVSFSLTPLSNIQFSGDIAALAQLLADHLQGTLDEGVLTGQIDGDTPSTDIGLWFNGTYWEYWNTLFGKYIPIDVIVRNQLGDATNIAKIIGTQTTPIV